MGSFPTWTPDEFVENSREICRADILDGEQWKRGTWDALYRRLVVEAVYMREVAPVATVLYADALSMLLRYLRDCPSRTNTRILVKRVRADLEVAHYYLKGFSAGKQCGWQVFDEAERRRFEVAFGLVEIYLKELECIDKPDQDQAKKGSSI